MEAFVYLRVHPGSIVPVRNQLTSSAVARRSIVVIGDWDVLCLIDGPDLASIGTGVLSEIQLIEGIARTYTAPVVETQQTQPIFVMPTNTPLPLRVPTRIPSRIPTRKPTPILPLTPTLTVSPSPAVIPSPTKIPRKAKPVQASP